MCNILHRSCYDPLEAMEREKLSSSVIVSAGYDDEREVLEIQFTNGRVYQYSKVPRLVYEQFMTASSAGRYFNVVIKPNYEAQLVYDARRPRGQRR